MKKITQKSFKDNLHYLLLLYIPVYIGMFVWLNSVYVAPSYTVMYSTLDDFIPFCPVFIVPYLLWFPYMAFVGLYSMFVDKKAFVRFMYSLMLSFSTIIIFFIVFPTEQLLRPDSYNSDLFSRLTALIQTIDSNQNVFPSGHVAGSIVTWLAVRDCKGLKNNKLILTVSDILCILIIASTVFLKQHSVNDILGSFVLMIPIYFVVYSKRNKALLSGKKL